MEIKRTLIVFTFVINVFSTNMFGKGDNPPEVVVKFINNVERLSNISNEDEEKAIKLREEMKECFAGKEVYGINIDKVSENNSEFPYLGLSTVSNSTTYCMKLYTYVFKDRTLKLSHQSMNTEVINAPGNNGKDVKYFYSTTIEKICICNSYVKKLWQIFEVPCDEKGNINGVINSLKTLDKEPNVIIGEELKREIEKSQKLSEQQYLNIAARYYTKKDYENAYLTYKKLTEMYDENAEGWYRLALLVFYHEKCYKHIYSNPRQKAKSFMEKAKDRAKGKLKEDANNVLQNAMKGNGNGNHM